VKDLVVGSGLGFEDRGTYELKGVPDAWHCTRSADGEASPRLKPQLKRLVDTEL
jgi:hypothetical protein